MFSTNTANAILNALTGRGSGSISSGTVYLALSSTTPAADGSNVTEPSDSNYSRILLGTSSAAATYMMGDPSNNQIKNVKEIHFNASAAAYSAPITYACLYTAETGGTFLGAGALTTALTVSAAGVVPTIPVNNFTITLS